MNPACFYVVLATNCGPENVINGPGTKNDCIKGEAASQIFQVAPREKEDSLNSKKRKFKKASGML